MSRPPSKDRRLVKVLTALRAHGGPARSPLYRWMRRHHDALAAAFAEIPPAWGPLSAELVAVGLTDADGKQPTAQSARQTWYRVRRDVARAREEAAAKAAALAPDEIAPSVHAVTPPPTAAQDPVVRSRPGMVLDIRPARAATGAPPAAAPAATAANTPGVATGAVPPVAGAPDPTPATPATESAAEQLRRLFATIDASKVPLPKVM